MRFHVRDEQSLIVKRVENFLLRNICTQIILYYSTCYDLTTTLAFWVVYLFLYDSDPERY